MTLKQALLELLFWVSAFAFITIVLNAHDRDLGGKVELDIEMIVSAATTAILFLFKQSNNNKYIL